MNTQLSTKTPLATVLLIAVALFSGLRPAQGQPATPDQLNAVSETAGGTILVPYFEVDLGNANGRNTIFTIDHTGRLDFVGGNCCNNNLATATLAHVTIWSDLGVPVFNFNVYLTGYDVETVNMRTVLTGALPQTASAGQDPNDTISPKGSHSQDINFASCNGKLPPAPLTAAQISDLTASLTGNPVSGQSGKCSGLNHNDMVARGYVTIDMVNNCTTRNAGDSGYFGPNGDATYQDHLTGEVVYLDPSNSIIRGTNVVHIHSSVSDPLVNTSGNYTFYGRTNGFTAKDGRQPLSTTFAARFNPAATVTPPLASLIVWRDPKVPQGYFTCGVNPAWYPLGQEGLTAFDEQEHPQRPVATPFPAATQLVQLGGTALPVSFPAGWLWLDLNTTVAGAVGPTGDLPAAQGWVQIIDGKFGVLHNAQQLDSATNAAHVTP